MDGSDRTGSEGPAGGGVGGGPIVFGDPMGSDGRIGGGGPLT